MTEKRHTAKSGPTPAEAKMLDAYDIFDRLLASKPAQARQLAYEVHTVALRYTPPTKTQKEQDNA